MDPNFVLSPADGVVIYVNRVHPGAIPVAEKKGKLLMLGEIEQSSLGKSELWQIGISMALTDVHVNRAPIGGRVTLINHHPGRFISLRNQDAAGLNERQTMIFENELVQVGVVQIASRLVRRIESYVKPGQSTPAGHRIGMIKFGSQVDLLVPVSQCTLTIKPGDRATAGITAVGFVLGCRLPATSFSC
jgi:phosphatidylserine decarboxylase